MFRYTHKNNKFLFYFLNESGSKIPVSEWEKLQSEVKI